VVPLATGIGATAVTLLAAGTEALERAAVLPTAGAVVAAAELP